VASVPHVGHMIDEISQPFRWTIDRIETPCPVKEAMLGSP
jgi:hypothetical protein